MAALAGLPLSERAVEQTSPISMATLTNSVALTAPPPKLAVGGAFIGEGLPRSPRIGRQDTLLGVCGYGGVAAGVPGAAKGGGRGEGQSSKAGPKGHGHSDVGPVLQCLCSSDGASGTSSSPRDDGVPEPHCACQPGL